MKHALNIRFIPGRYAVAKLSSDAEIPDWFNGPGFKAFVYSDDETTLVCREDRVPEEIPKETGWACLRTIGPFPFDAAGVVQSVIAPLSSHGIGVFVVCTFDGEHVLIPSVEINAAVKHLEAAGHTCHGREDAS